MARMFEYFVVCGLGPEIRTLDGSRGFHGTGITYLPSLLDQYPPPTGSPYPPPPPQLPTCVLPAGVEFHPSGFESSNSLSFPRSYPIVLTEGDGSKIYVSCIAFRDPICDDIVEAYRLPENYFADKCICLVSRSPNFQVLRDALEELFALCFSSTGSSVPLWDYIAYMVSKVLLPDPGKECVLFPVGSRLFFVEAPPPDGLPHADISFLPLVQCLYVDNLIKFFTAVLLERRILLRSCKYSLLTIASEAICHLIYPIRWQHVYIPLLFFSGVDYIDAPTPYMMGLYSGVDTSTLAMDGVVVVDLDYNLVTSSEEIPPIPEPELGFLRSEIMKLLYPSVVGIDSVRSVDNVAEPGVTAYNKPWGKDQDQLLRLIFLKFFASILSGYRSFVEPNSSHTFDTQGFLKKRSLLQEAMVAQFLDTHGFLDYLERAMNSDESSNNLLHKLQDAIEQGDNMMSILPEQVSEPEIITMSAPPGLSDSKYIYERFPSNDRTEMQEEKRKQILASAVGAMEAMSSSPSMLLSRDSRAETLSPMERAAERERMVLDIKVKLQGLWLRLLKLGATEDPLSSFEYGTILALIESDAEGIGGSGFVECIREHIHSGWICQLTEQQFVAVKELLKTAITRATSRDDLATVRDALEVSSEIYKKDKNNVSDYIERHLLSLPIWEETRFWEWYFDNLNNSSSMETRLVIMASHMAGLGIPDVDAWHSLESIAAGFEHFVELRGFFSHIQQLRNDYWGVRIVNPPPVLASPRSQDAGGENQLQVEASVVGRSWVQSMFSRETTLRMNSFSRVRRWASDARNSSAKEEVGRLKHKRIETSIRTLNGHSGAISALHCVTKREVWDLVGDREDAGFIMSGSTDCSVMIWDPSLLGSELKATLKGHSGTIRSVSSDRSRIASGSDDQSAMVWDKQSSQLIQELKGHEGQVNCVKMLSGERVLTAAHDGLVKMWDVRSDSCVATIGRCAGAVLCMEYHDSSGILAASGRDSSTTVWDIRSGRQIQKLVGHGKWVRSLRMVEDVILTGSDDWTARLWSLSRGSCDAVLGCHSGPVLAVEYSAFDKGIMTGSADGLVRLWERNDSGVRCVKNVTVHNAAILSITAGEHWLGVGAADNSMSLFHRPQERLGTLMSAGSKMGGWQLYRKPHRTSSLVRCVVSDLERKRICSGGRDGLLRLWEATINL